MLQTDYDYDYTAESGAWLAGFMLIYMLSMLVFTVITYVLMGLATSALFKKVGIEPWKGWVPVYSSMTLLKLGGQNPNWIWAIFVPGLSIATTIFIYIGLYRTNIAFRKDTGMFVLAIFFPVIWMFILGYGSAAYEPWLIAQRGYGMPLEGYGSPEQPVQMPQQAWQQPQPAWQQQGYPQQPQQNWAPQQQQQQPGWPAQQQQPYQQVQDPNQQYQQQPPFPQA